MSHEELVQKTEHLLGRKLTPEEHKFLTLATQAFKEKTNVNEPPKAKAEVA
jgi:hypothetical protein